MGFSKKLGLLLCGLLPYVLFAQAGLLREKRIGLYISSTQFAYSDSYNMSSAQFLKIHEDRSYAGKLKSELIIRIGELLCPQIQALAGADTVFFLNADLRRGYRFQQVYDPEANRLTDSLEIAETDLLLVINDLDLAMRNHRSVFIRSNQMFTEKVPVKKADLSVTLFDPGLPDLALVLHTCYDEYSTPKVPFQFDMYRDASKLGSFLSQLFSHWWVQMENGVPDNCEEG